MNKRIRSFLCWASLCCLLYAFSSCVSSRQPGYTFNRKYAPDELKADVVLLRKILEANHPSLYWYTPKDSMDYYFDNAINSINDSLTEVAFRNKVASCISKIRCGHTSVRLSKAYDRLASKNRYPQFPLYLKVWGDSLVLLGSAFPKDSTLKRGTIITSVNGKNARQLLDPIYDVISTDGYSDNYKSQVVSNNFPAWYKAVFGLDSIYHVAYIDSSGKEATTTVRNFAPVKDTAKRKDSTVRTIVTQPLKEPSRKEMRELRLLSKRSMFIDSATSTAFMRITSFNGGRLRKFYRKSFRRLQEQHIQHLVIDLRENGGGNVELSTKLARYMTDSSFRIGDTVAAINRTFPYKKHIHNWLLYWFPMNFLATRKDDDRIHFRYYENHRFKPKKKNHYDGEIYILQGGVTFSASTMFISTMKGQHNVTVAGEETGGGYYGNSAMHLPTIELPNSHLRVVLPMYRLVIDHTREKNGRGVIPDLYIPPSSIAIRQGVDYKIDQIKKYIAGKKIKAAGVQ